MRNIQKKSVLLTGAKLLLNYELYSLEDPQGLLAKCDALEIEPGMILNYIVGITQFVE